MLVAPSATRGRAASVSRSIPPPVGGWDTRSALSDMPIKNAVILDNWFPDTSKITLRRGYASHATGMSGAVESLMAYTPRTGTSKMFAGNGTSIFDVTSAGAVGAGAVTGLTNVRFQHLNMGTSGGQFLFCCNGADQPQTYNGSAWANTTITGPTVTSLIWCCLHQRRLWVGEKDALVAWYGGTDSIGGAFTSFPLYGVATLGGYIMAAGTWSRDGGSGPDDYIVFLTSEGEAIVYSGIDPSASATWSLVGVFRIGVPIGRRCLIKAGSDMLAITEDGFLPMSRMLAVDRSQSEQVALSAQINSAVNDATRLYEANYGWQPILYPHGRMLIFNIPISSTLFEQYVFNTITKAPCRFTGVPAKCWELFSEVPYFGSTDGVVYKFDTGTTDGGAAIEGDMVQAFHHFGSPAQTKSFKLAELVYESDGDVSLALDLNTDYAIDAPDSTPTGTGSTAAVWGTAVWGTDVWGGSGNVYYGWRGISGIGRAASLRVRVSTNAYRPSLISSRVIFTPGGALY